MSPDLRLRIGRTVALMAAGLLLAVAVASPLASADHAYSHRYVLIGRVVDADGKPVPGATVQVEPEYFSEPGPCSAQPGTETDAWGETRTRLTTNGFGEFIFCIHTHRMARESEAKFTISVDNTTVEVPTDGLSRRSYVTVQLSEPREIPEANLEAWQNNYTLSGRLWKETGKTSVEYITVYGETVNYENLTLTFTPADGGEPITAQTVTNGYGDFAVRLPVPATVTDGKIRIVGAGFDETYDADMTLRASDHELFTKESKAGLITMVGLGIAGLVLVAVALGGGFKGFGKGGAAPKGRKGKR